MNLRALVRISLMTSLTAVFAQIAVPLGITPVPISLATFSVMMAGALLSPRHSFAAMVLYLLLGFAGLPVFAGFSSGLSRLMGPTGGFLLGYAVLAPFVGFLLSKLRLRALVPALFLGAALHYALGTLWFMFITGTTLLPALSLCVFPFLPGDALKIAAAALCILRLTPSMTSMSFQKGDML